MSNLRMSSRQFVASFKDPSIRKIMRSRVDIIGHDATQPSEPTNICGECSYFNGMECWYHGMRRRYTERACISAFTTNNTEKPVGMQLALGIE